MHVRVALLQKYIHFVNTGDKIKTIYVHLSVIESDMISFLQLSKKDLSPKVAKAFITAQDHLI